MSMEIPNPNDDGETSSTGVAAKGEMPPQDLLTERHRAIRLSLPAAALFSIPFGFRLYRHYGSMFGISFNLTPADIIRWAGAALTGAMLFSLVTLVSSLMAINACSKPGNSRLGIFALLGLFNLIAAIVAGLVLVGGCLIVTGTSYY
jgi:hypothetical protein